MKVTGHKIQLYLPRALYRYLKNAAQRRKASPSAFLREMIRQSMISGAHRVDDPLVSLIGKARRRGPRDGSRRVDTHLYGMR